MIFSLKDSVDIILRDIQYNRYMFITIYPSLLNIIVSHTDHYWFEDGLYAFPSTLFKIDIYN